MEVGLSLNNCIQKKSTGQDARGAHLYLTIGEMYEFTIIFK